jgi:hypothetical protein
MITTYSRVIGEREREKKKERKNKTHIIEKKDSLVTAYLVSTWP